MSTGVREEALEIMRRLEPLIMQLVRDVSEIKGRMADMPTARDFGRLEGRLDEISRRLPTTIGYTPPAGKKRA